MRKPLFHDEMSFQTIISTQRRTEMLSMSELLAHDCQKKNSEIKAYGKHHIPSRKSQQRECHMKGERGFALVETLVSVAIIGIITVTFVVGLGTGSKLLAIVDEKQTAKNLAQSQMEYVLNQTYAPSYTLAPIPSEYTGYSVAITAENITSRDTDIQRIKLTVSHQGRTILLAGNCTLEDYKVKK